MEALKIAIDSGILVKEPTDSTRLELQEKRFGTVVVRTWKRADNNWSICPWLFAIQEDGHNERTFTGVPNYCETRHSALMRGWYRAKWLQDGTYYKHYSSPYHGPLPGIYKAANVS